jgi:hypothetical protein
MYHRYIVCLEEERHKTLQKGSLRGVPVLTGLRCSYYEMRLQKSTSKEKLIRSGMNSRTTALDSCVRFHPSLRYGHDSTNPSELRLERRYSLMTTLWDISFARLFRISSVREFTATGCYTIDLGGVRSHIPAVQRDTNIMQAIGTLIKPRYSCRGQRLVQGQSVVIIEELRTQLPSTVMLLEAVWQDTKTFFQQFCLNNGRGLLFDQFDSRRYPCMLQGCH